MWGALLLALGPLTAIAQNLGADLVVTHANVVTAPGVPALADATIVVRGGRIASITLGTAPPADLPVLDAAGRTVTAGLWNCHVHLTDPAIRHDPVAVVRDMLLQYGFTSVVDTGSFLPTSKRIRDDIDEGRFDGPRIVLANGSFVPEHGTPAYLPEDLLPELVDPADGAHAVNAVLDAGADGIKIMAGSFQGPNETLHLAPAVIRAVVDAAHARSSFVIAHPQSRTGLLNAVDGGVDILAHTTPEAGALEADLVQRMLGANVALIPTLKLWRWELERNHVPAAVTDRYERDAVFQVTQWRAAGGELLFGTDVGYMVDWSTRDEFDLLVRAGLGADAILTMLTTAPAARFPAATRTLHPSTVSVGEPADLVVYARDPWQDPRAFAEVAATIRAGRVVFRAGHTSFGRDIRANAHAAPVDRRTRRVAGLRWTTASP